MPGLAYLPRSTSIEVGMMCRSPERSRFEVAFRNFALGPAIAREFRE
jgi:uncharacterized protein